MGPSGGVIRLSASVSSRTFFFSVPVCNKHCQKPCRSENLKKTVCFLIAFSARTRSREWRARHCTQQGRCSCRKDHTAAPRPQQPLTVSLSTVKRIIKKLEKRAEHAEVVEVLEFGANRKRNREWITESSEVSLLLRPAVCVCVYIYICKCAKAAQVTCPCVSVA